MLDALAFRSLLVKFLEAVVVFLSALVNLLVVVLLPREDIALMPRRF